MLRLTLPPKQLVLLYFLCTALLWVAHVPNPLSIRVKYKKFWKLKVLMLSLVQIWETAMASHSNTLAWKIPWMEEPGRLQSMGSLRVRHDWETSLSLFTFMHWRRKWQPTPVFLPGESRDGEARWAAIYGVTQGWTWLKWLSSSSSVDFYHSLGFKTL